MATVVTLSQRTLFRTRARAQNIIRPTLHFICRSRLRRETVQEQKHFRMTALIPDNVIAMQCSSVQESLSEKQPLNHEYFN